MVLGLYGQCQADASVATRTGTIAHRAIQKIQQNGPLIRNHLETSQVAFQKMKAGYRFFQRIKEIIKKKKEDNLRSEDTQTSDLVALKNQIQDCVPDGEDNQKCYSPCVKDHTKYRWCYTSSERRASQWMACSCTIKKAILEYLDVSRQNILRNPPTPWTYLEITMVVIALSTWGHTGSRWIHCRILLFPTNLRRPLPGPRECFPQSSISSGKRLIRKKNMKPPP